MSIFELFKYNLFLNYVFYVEISPGCSLEGLVLKLKLQHFGHLMRRVDSLEKTLMLGGIGGRRRRGWDGWMASPTQWTLVWVNSRSWWWTRRPGALQFMGSQRVGHDWATELNWCVYCYRSVFWILVKFYRSAVESYILILWYILITFNKQSSPFFT